MGFLLFASPASFSLIPVREENGYRLGQVTFRRIGLLNGAFVALAPLLLLPIALWLMTLGIDAFMQHAYWPWFGWASLSANLLFASLPSRTDWRVGAPSLVFYLVIAAAIWGTLNRPL